MKKKLKSILVFVVQRSLAVIMKQNKKEYNLLSSRLFKNIFEKIVFFKVLFRSVRNILGKIGIGILYILITRHLCATPIIDQCIKKFSCSRTVCCC